MSLIAAIDPATATGKAHDLLRAVKTKLGLVPNMTRVMANSPAVLEGYLGLSGSLAGGLLKPKIRDAEVAEISAHVALNVLTNYFNKATEVDIDFPIVSFRKTN